MAVDFDWLVSFVYAQLVIVFSPDHHLLIFCMQVTQDPDLSCSAMATAAELLQRMALVREELEREVERESVCVCVCAGGWDATPPDTHTHTRTESVCERLTENLPHTRTHTHARTRTNWFGLCSKRSFGVPLQRET